MAGNKPYHHLKHYPAYLLPFVPPLFRGRKVPSPTSSIDSNAAIKSCSNDTDGPRQRSAYRDSVVSATSTRSSTSNTSDASDASVASDTAPVSIFTPPSSYGSAFAYRPSFATSLTTEPQQDVNCTLSSPHCVDFVAQWELPNNSAHPPRQRLIRTQPETLRCNKCSNDLAFRAQIVSKGFTGRHGRAYLVSAPPTSPGHLFAPEVPASSDNSRETKENNLINIRVGQPENRQLVTGAHVVADIFCKTCNNKVGWKYVDARDASQKYKVGKFILEMARIATYHSWEDADDDRQEQDHYRSPSPSEQITAQNGVHNICHVHDEDGVFPWYDSDLDPGNAVTDTVGSVRTLSIANKHTDNYGLLPDDAIEFDSEDEDECDEIFAGTWDAQAVANRRLLKQYALTV